MRPHHLCRCRESRPYLRQAAAGAIDYALTFYLVGGIERILKYDYSPTLVYAVEHGIVIPYLVFTIFFYYVAGYTVLKYLMDSGISHIGVYIILLVCVIPDFRFGHAVRLCCAFTYLLAV